MSSLCSTELQEREIFQWLRQMGWFALKECASPLAIKGAWLGYQWSFLWADKLKNEHAEHVLQASNKESGIRH